VILSDLEIHFLLFGKEFREGTYPGLFPVCRGKVMGAGSVDLRHDHRKTITLNPCNRGRIEEQILSLSVMTSVMVILCFKAYGAIILLVHRGDHCV
jgi:hypothetical protein